MELERRYLPMAEGRVGVREAEGHKPLIRGYAALFNQWSHPLPGDGFTFRERILPGAFDAALADPNLDVIANFDHNNRDLLGRSSSGTLNLFVDQRGLGFELDPPDTTLGRDLVTLVKRGDLGANGSGCSFAFTVGEDGEDVGEYEGERGVMARSIRSVSGLYDIAICPLPAYPNTSLAVRSLQAWREHKHPPAIAPKRVDRTKVVVARAVVTIARAQ